MALFDLMKQKRGFESVMDYVTDSDLQDALSQIIAKLDDQINNALGKILNKFKDKKKVKNE